LLKTLNRAIDLIASNVTFKNTDLQAASQRKDPSSTKLEGSVKSKSVAVKLYVA
jgi:hypothetical protein